VPDDIPVVLDNPSINIGSTVVNVVGEYFASTKFDLDMPGRRVKYNDTGVKCCWGEVRYAQSGASWVNIDVPFTDGCGSSMCVDLSDRLYAMIVVYNSYNDTKTVHVLCVDSIPAIVVARRITSCAVKWIADVLDIIAEDMLRYNAQGHVEKFVTEHTLMKGIIRRCNARFLKRISIEELTTRIQGGEA
jgi:hypothetical protein